MKDKKLVTIVIPNYNGSKYNENCLNSLEQYAKEVPVIVVDNGSSDGSADWIEKNRPEVEVIRLEENYGFSRAVNEGIWKATTPYVLLLNNDTEITENFVEEAVAQMEEDEKIFSVSTKMIQLFDKNKIDDAGDEYCALGWAFARGKDKPVTDFEESADVFAACAGAALYRKSVFEKIGYFDEAHFAYLEDIDVSYRAKIYGYRNVYTPKARVYHVGSGSSGSRHNDFKVKLSTANTIYLAYKNMPLFQLILNSPFLILGLGVKAMFFGKKGLFESYKKGLLNGFALCKPNKKIKFKWKHLSNYIKIQGLLWRNIGKRFG